MYLLLAVSSPENWRLGCMHETTSGRNRDHGSGEDGNEKKSRTEEEDRFKDEG